VFVSNEGVTFVSTREQVRALFTAGRSQSQIARELDVTKSTVAYHVRNLGVDPDDRFNRRYDWDEVQRYYDDTGSSAADCRQHFGFSRDAWYSAVARGAIVARPHGMPIEELVSKPRGRRHLKARLIGAGLLGTECERCGIDHWMGSVLALCLHHVNGDPNDNHLENLSVLCPNCHSQTDNFAGRNRHVKAA